MASKKSPYEILGISSSASQDDIKNAYRKLAKTYHPDLNPGKKEAEVRFKEISGAYELIGTPEQRSRYDRGELEEAQTRERPGPFYHQTQREGGRYSQSFGGTGEMDEDFLNSIFGRMGGSRPLEDPLYRMEVDFKDAVLGAEREIGLPSGKKLRVKIPAGVESGTKLRFAGHANVELVVKPSPLFRRNGSDIEVDLPISIAEAVLGGEVKTPTIDGTILLKVPPLVSSGLRLRIPGKGVPALKGGKRGDQFVVLKIVTPSTIDPEFKKAVEAWKARQPFDPRGVEP
jgi:DnaJ-class molecular chaperone